MTVDPDLFKALLRRFASGVTVVTFRDGERMGGLTVSSFCSLSLEPPLILVCIARSVASHEPIRRAGAFGVNFCRADQSRLCWDFASSTVDKDALIRGLPHRVSPHGSPLLGDALARLDCTVEMTYEGGDHTIFVGRVQGGALDPEGEALLYFDGALGAFEAFGS